MKFPGYHYERPREETEKLIREYNNGNQKIEIWNAFVDSNLSGVTDDDFSIIPRAIPLSYWPTLRRSVYEITKFTMKLLSLPEREIRAIVPRGPVRDHLLDKLEVLKHRNGRITGSYRFDMAVVDPPTPHNPPYLLEINEIGFDGLARSSFFQKTLLEHMPSLRGRLKSLDTAAAEIRNMQRLGNKIARIQYDSYNWDEEYLVQTAERMNTEIRLISPTLFKQKFSLKDYPRLYQESMRLKNRKTIVGKNWFPDAVNMSFAYGMKDYHEGHALYRDVIRSKTPQYGPFLTGLVASKTVLVLLADPLLRKKLLGSSRTLQDAILPAHLLSELMDENRLKDARDWVLKHADGCGGAEVFMNAELEKQLRKISPKHRHEWVLQKKTQLNLIDVNGILSRPKKAISDLGVFVEYDWANGKFQHFEIGGLMCRATNKSLKVNVSSGGLQVAVFLDRSC